MSRVMEVARHFGGRRPKAAGAELAAIANDDGSFPFPDSGMHPTPHQSIAHTAGDWHVSEARHCVERGAVRPAATGGSPAGSA
jgi:hypothetical protein